MYSDSKDNGFCNSVTPISGVFEGIIDFFKGYYHRWEVCNYLTISGNLLPHFPRDPESDKRQAPIECLQESLH